MLTACSTNTINVRNEKRGILKPSVRLEVIDLKKFLLDNESAPKPQYIQLIEMPGEVRYLTFLNKYNNSISFYDYSTEAFFKKVTFNRKGPDAIQTPMGYYIKSTDSIYIYNKILTQVVLVNDKSTVLKRISLRGKGNEKTWVINYPQYLPRTITPFIETSGELLLPGMHVTSIPKSIISSFKFTARIDLKTQNVRFSYAYPSNIYGLDSNWPVWGFTQVFAALHPDGDKLIFSFPVSHDLYIADLKSEKYTRVYAGSNFAGTINSLDRKPKKTTDKMGSTHFTQQDTYAAIIYDKYRDVYYRFLLNGIPGAMVKTSWREKPVTIIVMDKDFNYLGETTIGKGDKEWYWQNSFVTKEGLNVEYIEKDSEDYLTLKIFAIKNI